MSNTDHMVNTKLGAWNNSRYLCKWPHNVFHFFIHINVVVVFLEGGGAQDFPPKILIFIYRYKI